MASCEQVSFLISNILLKPAKNMNVALFLLLQCCIPMCTLNNTKSRETRELMAYTHHNNTMTSAPNNVQSCEYLKCTTVVIKKYR